MMCDTTVHLPVQFKQHCRYFSYTGPLCPSFFSNVPDVNAKRPMRIIALAELLQCKGQHLPLDARGVPNKEQAGLTVLHFFSSFFSSSSSRKSCRPTISPLIMLSLWLSDSTCPLSSATVVCSKAICAFVATSHFACASAERPRACSHAAGEEDAAGAGQSTGRVSEGGLAAQWPGTQVSPGTHVPAMCTANSPWVTLKRRRPMASVADDKHERHESVRR